MSKPLRVGIQYNADEQPWSHKWKAALVKGIRHCGDEVQYVQPANMMTEPLNVTVTWGLRGRRKTIMEHTRSRGGNHLVMERGFMGDRVETWTALSWNGIAGRAQFPDRSDPSRLERFFPGIIKPWRDAKDAAVVMGQVEGDATTKHVDLERWYQTAVKTLLEQGWGTVYFRPHPIEHRKKRFKVPAGAVLPDDLTILETLDRCGNVITFNSTSAVDAVLHGVRTHSADPGSPAWDVTSHDYALRHFPREEWAARLAWKQWSEDEMASGEAWQALREVLGR